MLRRSFAALLAIGLAACAPAPPGATIVAPAPARNLLAVSAQGASTVRVLHVDGPSIVLLRTVYLPHGERVHSVAWSDDERELVIATSDAALALDTRTWRVGPLSHLAAASRRDAPADGRR